MYISYGEMTIFAKQHMLSKLSSLTRLEWSFAYHPLFFYGNHPLLIYVSFQEMYTNKESIDLQ